MSGGDESLVLRLVAFDPASAERVLSWVGSAEELFAWCGRTDFPPGAEVFERWHADPDVQASLLVVDEGGGEALAGYGELWVDHAEDEVELARILVDPARRGRGLGRSLTRLLVAEASRLQLGATWLRVLPTNAAALACYTAAGFVRATPDQEARFNAGQPRAYTWMRWPLT